MGTPSPTPCKPFEKGLTLNCIASRISCVWNCLVGNIYAHRHTNARLKTGQGLKALAGCPRGLRPPVLRPLGAKITFWG